ncbi:ECF RNA polymerase sigma-E factor [Posidoniimonas polymericola]|uniref:ECF RNA polymerase sigma-E factor n=1 Tax=Posidoniimonas polymericola TaxID=2528002 RepID=A0A5C5YGL6_9BACT|nr:sigma-70 family RNA polymerase sigma factor [Posidoniimonas polymericola]TWT73701.1 ECF RNA polymerase sigma-E factor [Posidoniimonas polymericola]
MPEATNPDALLIEQIRLGKPDAWNRLIGEYEGRLLAFVESRLRRRAASEDVVQETFIGFLTSLPNYDARRPLEGYLFSIAAHKLTDYLRREGRRPALPLSSTDGSDGEAWDLPGGARGASSIARSGERKGLEEQALAEALEDQFERWCEKDDYQKIMVMELLFTRGWGNKQVAEELTLSEQQVANFKYDFLARIRSQVRKQQLSEDIFPELYEE